jgi:hypothetical protein
VTFFLPAEDLNWGGYITSNTDFSSTSDQVVDQFNSVDFWLEYELSSNYTLKTDVGYSFSYEDGEIDNLPEVSNLLIYGLQPGSSFKLGRMYFSDFNSNLINAPLDGLEYTIYGTNVEIVTGAAYTGFVFNQNSNVILTATDEEAAEDGDLFASARFLQLAELNVTYSDNETFIFAILTQGDMADEETLEAGYGILDSFYLMLGFDGVVNESMEYNVYAIGETGNHKIYDEDRSLLILAGAMGVELDFLLDLPLDPVLSIDGFYSTGDSWSRSDWQGSSIDASKDSVNQYNPFSVEDIGYVYSTRAGNIFYGNIGLTLNISTKMTVSVNSLTLFRSVDGPVYEIPVNESNSSLYLGEELYLNSEVQVSKYVGFGVEAGVFFPNDALVSDGIQYKAGVNLTISYGD